MSVLRRRLLFVTGKGGVGRTTVTTALGVAAAQAGLNTLILELDGLGAVGSGWDGRARAYAPRSLRPRLDHASLTPAECAEDFGRTRLGMSRMSSLVFNNRMMQTLLDALPGLGDLVQLGKLENRLLDPGRGETAYDLVLVDAPATGHGLTLLAAARTMAEMTRVGPFFELARTVEALVQDPQRTGVVVVTLPEELPVSESLELVGALQADGFPPSLIVVNQLRAARLPEDPPWETVRPALAEGGPRLEALLHLADDLHLRQHSQEQAMARLADTLPEVIGANHAAVLPVVRVPRVPGGVANAADIERFGASLRLDLEGA